MSASLFGCLGSVATVAVFAGSPDVTIHSRETFARFPDAVRLANGDLLAVFRENGIHGISETGKVVCRRSADQGRTWGEPVVICDRPGTDDRDPGILQARDGTIWVGVCGQRPKDYDSYVVRSLDNGKTWEPPRLVSRSDSSHFIVYPALEMSNGEFLWIGCTALKVTGPGGRKTWVAGTDRCRRATFILKRPWDDFEWDRFVHPQLGLADEWDVAEIGRGHLIAILRQQPAEVFYQAESRDFGRTWSRARKTTIWHSPRASRPKIYRLASGVLVVAYAERTRHRIVAIPSFDGGRTWRNGRIVTILDDPGYCNPRDGDYSYPVMVRAGRDAYLFVYYAHPGQQSRHKGIFGNFVPAAKFMPR